MHAHKTKSILSNIAWVTKINARQPKGVLRFILYLLLQAQLGWVAIPDQIKPRITKTCPPKQLTLSIEQKIHT